ncbi:MAG: DNA polymerase III subunit beta [Thermodesulfobacteriota bacterium]
MEFNIARDDFLTIIGRVQSIVEKRHTMPILANVLLETDGDALVVKVTDQEVGLAAHHPALVKKPGRVTVPARKLYEILRELPSEDVYCRVKENNWLEVKCGPACFSITGLDASEFPTLPSVDEASYASLPCLPLKAMLEMTVIAASTDETRYNLNGVFWEFRANDGPNLLRLVATDGHRLSLMDWGHAGLEALSLPKGVIVPRKGIAELRNLVADAQEGEELQLCFHKNHGLFRREPFFLIVRLIEGDFPDYEQVIPKVIGKRFTLTREAFLAAMRRVSLLAAEKGRGVKLAFKGTSLEISARNPDLGEASETLEVKSETEEELAISFNARYIIDILSALKADEVVMELTDELSPGVIRPLSDERQLSLIMPMRM